jgi:hypothetical protein
MNGRIGEPGHPSRSDAIRILIGLGLSTAYEERKSGRYKNAGNDRASDLIGIQISTLSHPARA